MSGGHPAGARVVFTRGSVRLDPPVAVPEGAVAAQVSVISPGTELRRLAATRTGPELGPCAFRPGSPWSWSLWHGSS